MICAYCATENPGNSKFCKKCGKSITSAPTVLGVTKLCPNGHVMDAIWDVCPYCPKPAPRPAGSESPGSAETDKTGPTDEATKLMDGGRISRGEQTKLDESTLRRQTPQRQDRTIITGNDSAIHSEGMRKGRSLVGWLVTFSHRPDGEDYQLREGKNVIGVDRTCDIVLADPAVSGAHAVIVHRLGQSVIEDQLSTNGSFVNGDDIEPRGVRTLEDGDTLKVGDTLFVFKCFQRPTE